MQLSTFSLHGNRLRSTPSSILNGPASKLIAHLRAKLPQSEPAAPAPSVGSQLYGAGTRLELRGRGLSELPTDLFALGGKLSTLDASQNSIRAIPEELAQLEGLVELTLSENRLQSLPASICDCAALARVDCSRNQLRSLPEGLGRLTSLLYLDLSRNMLAGHVSIEGTSKLQRLDLSQNRIGSLLLDGCESLSELYLAQNQLTALPSAIANGELRALATADLSNNKLRVLSVHMVHLRALQRLDLSNNSLKQVPAEMGLMSELSILSLHGNLLRAMPSSLINGPCSKLLDYLRAKLPLTEERAGE